MWTVTNVLSHSVGETSQRLGLPDLLKSAFPDAKPHLRRETNVSAEEGRAPRRKKKSQKNKRKEKRKEKENAQILKRICLTSKCYHWGNFLMSSKYFLRFQIILIFSSYRDETWRLSETENTIQGEI